MEFDRPWRLWNRPQPTGLRLLSIHIPKTAGTSFRLSLTKIYGKRSVARLDIRHHRNDVRLNNKPYAAKRLPSGACVVHGHFSPTGFSKYFSVPTDVPLITWLRDPVERVISEYFYLAKQLSKEINPKGTGSEILSSLQRSLVEYAQTSPCQNRISFFLEGASLEQFRFIGFMEDYGQDLNRLSKILGWPQYKEFNVNTTSSTPRAIDKETIEKIRECNQADIELYARALDLKANGYWSPE